MRKHNPPSCQLTAEQETRLDYARRDLENFRAADLAQLDPAGLILTIARLLTRLDDTLQIVEEITEP
ncbi:hypothetical protein ACFWFF_01670 [Streptomyces sp. NPDC060223]|uniref:hypothetical protein n=1 Tax=unclassified Streptomyces TaxID=2593676 RepID=UPI00363EBB16